MLLTWSRYGSAWPLHDNVWTAGNVLSILIQLWVWIWKDKSCALGTQDLVVKCHHLSQYVSVVSVAKSYSSLTYIVNIQCYSLVLITHRQCMVVLPRRLFHTRWPGAYTNELPIICRYSLAGQPLHTEEGSGVMPILDLFWRLCKMLCDTSWISFALVAFVVAGTVHVRASRSSLALIRVAVITATP